MHIKHLNLVNFRNYPSVDISLKPGINLLIGGNGQGKTNLAEAIIFSASLETPRYGYVNSMIRLGQQQAIVRVLAGFNDRENLIEIEINESSSNRAKVNRSDLTRVRDVLGYVKTVFFTPEDTEIVRGDPSDRRRFLDDLLVQFSPRLSGVLADYDRTLRQRNSLLKTSKNLPKDSPGLSTLEAWDESLVNLGSEIILQRFELIEKLKPYIQKIYQLISEDEREAKVSLVSSVLTSGLDSEVEQGEINTSNKELVAQQFRQRLTELRTKELERGVTLVGPHRDDVRLMLGEYPAKGFISYGESWSYAVSLKLASAEMLRAESNAGDPVLILDDVFSSLDDDRLGRLLSLVSGYEQVIITDAIRGKKPAFDAASIFRIESGKVEVIQ